MFAHSHYLSIYISYIHLRTAHNLGFTFAENALLLEPLLVDVIFPVSQHHGDWMHIVCASGGVWPNAAFELVSTLEEHEVLVADIYACVRSCTPPANFNQTTIHGHEVFSPENWAASKGNGSLRCYASEALSLYPVMRRFIVTVVRPQGICLVACAAFLKLCDVMDLLQAIPTGRVDEPMLEAPVVEYMTLHVLAFGTNSCHQKFHNFGHLPRWLGRHGLLINCWAHERKHRVPKRFATDVCNTYHNWESTVLQDCTNDHIAALQRRDLFRPDSFLLGSHGRVSPTMTALLSAEFGAGVAFERGARARVATGGVVAVGDVVCVLYASAVRQMDVGRVQYLRTADGVAIALVSLWGDTGYAPPAASGVWTISDANPELVLVDDILDAVTVRISHANSSAVVFLPWKCRLQPR